MAKSSKQSKPKTLKLKDYEYLNANEYKSSTDTKNNDSVKKKESLNNSIDALSWEIILDDFAI